MSEIVSPIPMTPACREYLDFAEHMHTLAIQSFGIPPLLLTDTRYSSLAPYREVPRPCRDLIRFSPPREP